MTEEKPFIVSELENKRLRNEFIDTYFMEPGTEIFNTPYGCGYWCAGVAYISRKGWLAYEFDEAGEDPLQMDHSAAIGAARAGEELPPKYKLMDKKFAQKVYDAGCDKSGLGWTDRDSDLGDIDNLIQWVWFGELRYG